MFDKILIANRGEIACRVIRTARRLGIGTVAVYSAADRGALHVAMADEAVAVGPAPAAESYLRAERIVEAAARTGAAAIHPGYGFLAENSDFARACGDAGLTFIGPPPEAIRAMGSKRAAKALMQEAGVPVVPGEHGGNQDPKHLAAAAAEIGFPVLIKASAGGGGKGMRRVDARKDFADALDGARREAASAFGDDTVLIEKFVERPRHIELQVFADQHGNTLHLFERDCSIQRRHQKVIEEAPAPGLDDDRRRRMGAVAVEAARAIGYVGAGTVEFIVGPDGVFYFMEMNTRLQVEHPVTEMITGLDLVEWQLRVAAGEVLPRGQDDLAMRGHAIEARLYAEDPARGFLPSTGTLRHLRPPEASDAVRWETGVRAGDAISMHYDPMIAKLVVWSGAGRDDAVRRLGRALGACEVAGVATNRDLLAAIAGHGAFAAGGCDTGFVEEHFDALMPAPPALDATVLACGALAIELRRRRDAAARAAGSGDPHSPWHLVNGWRLNDVGRHALRLAGAGEEVALSVAYADGGIAVALPSGDRLAADGVLDGDRLTAVVDGRKLEAGVAFLDDTIHLWIAGQHHRLAEVDPLAAVAGIEVAEDRLTAPMSGKIISVLVEPGAELDAGMPILILEAMKMEHTITAPADGTVQAIHFAVGDQVDEGAALVAFDAKEG
jgi:3-methylcrotonyl-CoA carboxylase alpha subunit